MRARTRASVQTGWVGIRARRAAVMVPWSDTEGDDTDSELEPGSVPTAPVEEMEEELLDARLTMARWRLPWWTLLDGLG